MKKLFSIMFLTLAMASSVFAAGDVNINVNGFDLPVKGVVIEGRTMVPVRGIFEKVGYTVEWNAETKTATLTKGSDKIVMTNGNTYFTYNGSRITPDVPHQIVDGSFMLPLRAVSEALNAIVDWNAETKTASIRLSTGLKIGNILTLD